MMMGSTLEKSIEEAVHRRSIREDEPDLDIMAHRVQSLFKFKHFYNQIDFSLEQRLAIAKTTFEPTDPSGSYGFVENR